MKSFITTTQFFIFFLLVTNTTNAQARLTIENNSIRLMTVKVIKSVFGKGTLHEIVIIEAQGSETIYFSESGYYFTKTKAVLKNSETIYRKGDPFQVTNDDTGYSILTLTFSITESKTPIASGGKQISKTEFDQD